MNKMMAFCRSQEDIYTQQNPELWKDATMLAAGSELWHTLGQVRAHPHEQLPRFS